MNWSRRFDDPVPMPDGRMIRTIGEAAEYATSLPRKTGAPKPWQLAAKLLQEAAEHGGPFVFMAQIVFYKAVHGEALPPIGNPEGKKKPQFGKAKASPGHIAGSHNPHYLGGFSSGDRSQRSIWVAAEQTRRILLLR